MKQNNRKKTKQNKHRGWIEKKHEEKIKNKAIIFIPSPYSKCSEKNHSAKLICSSVTLAERVTFVSMNMKIITPYVSLKIYTKITEAWFITR